MKPSILALALLLAAGPATRAGNNAAFTSQSVPTRMEAGGTYRVELTFANTGNTTWTETGGIGSFRLGSQNPPNNTIWGPNNRATLAPGEQIRPRTSKTFTFTVTAPPTPGNYSFQWQMVHEGVSHWFGARSPRQTITVVEAATGFSFDSTRVTSLRIRGRNLLEGTGGIYLIGSADGSDAQGRSVCSIGGANGLMHTDNPTLAPAPPFRLTFTRLAPDRLGFRAEIGPVPAAFATLSMPFDFNLGAIDTFTFNGTSYRLQCTARDGSRKGSGGRYDTLIPPRCEIRNQQGTLLGIVGVALTDRPTSWGEVTGPYGSVRVTITRSVHYRSMAFYNHFGTHNLELSFGSLRKGETGLLEGEIRVTPRP